MALYLRRVETVVSLKQLLQQAAPPADEPGCSAAAAAAAAELEPDAPVAGIAWSRLAKYSYACDAAPKQSLSRVQSDSSFARVPDMDDGPDAFITSSASSTFNKPAAAAPSKAALAALAAAGGGQHGFSVATPGADSDGEEGSSCDGSVVDAGCVPVRSLLDTALLAMWEECAEMGLFRYDVTACPTKVVPGRYGFVAQLNEGRYSKKRPTEFRVDQVVQAFDPTKFNFTKAFKKEVLFAFEPAERPGQASRLQEARRCNASPNVVMINVSPIDYGHVLLCPKVLDCIPQVLSPATLLTALHFALEVNNPYLRVGFNSLGAFATINHLHFQAYYLNAPLPCERAPSVPLSPALLPQGRRPDGATISRLCDYPVRGWVVEGSSLAAMAQVVGEAALAMQRHNIPHNVLIADCGSRVFIFPQCYAEKQARGIVPEHLLDIGVNPAVWEISGHMVLKRRDDYERFSEAAAWELLAAVSLTEDELDRAAALVFGGAADGRAERPGMQAAALLPAAGGKAVGAAAAAAAAEAAAAVPVFCGN